MKIGIITHYYRSNNCGGLLQSFALQKILANYCSSCLQICYHNDNYKNKLFHFAKKLCVGIFHLKDIASSSKSRKKCRQFRDSVPHTKRVYNNKNISNCDSEFDIFVVGSDQVWNPSNFGIGYSLSFTDKPKFAYAASVAANSIPENKLPFYKSSLQSFQGISVREHKAAELLSPFCTLIETLDPVFLIDDDEWIKMADRPLLDTGYVFCYFLSDASSKMQSILDYCSKNNLKIIMLKQPNQKKLNKVCYFDSDPITFLKLIRFANWVFTDSFHAISFSYIFKKNFNVIKRNSKNDMSSRIVDILDKMNLSERMVDTDFLFDKIDYSLLDSTKMNYLRKKSFDFIEEIKI